MKEYSFTHFTFLAHDIYCVHWSFYCDYYPYRWEKLKIHNLPKGQTTDWYSVLGDRNWRNTHLFVVLILHPAPSHHFWTPHREVPSIPMPRSSQQPHAQRSPVVRWKSAAHLSWQTLHCQSSQWSEQAKNMLSAPGVSPCRGNWVLANRGQRSLWPGDEFRGLITEW